MTMRKLSLTHDDYYHQLINFIGRLSVVQQNQTEPLWQTNKNSGKRENNHHYTATTTTTLLIIEKFV